MYMHRYLSLSIYRCPFIQNIKLMIFSYRTKKIFSAPLCLVYMTIWRFSIAAIGNNIDDREIK